MDNTPSAIKTYAVMFFTGFLALLPNSIDGWTSVFELIASFFAVLLVIWRFKREFFAKQNGKKT